jgi:hypothetical protein
MKRTLITLMSVAVFGMALAGPPVDVQLVCGEAEDAPIIGVASLVEDRLHLSVIDGALEACLDGVFGVADGTTVFTVAYTLEDGVASGVQVTFAEDEAYAPKLSYATVPEVAVEGMLGAQRNRAAAAERAAQARERAQEHAGEPPLDQPSDGDQERDRERDQDCGDGEPACDGDGPGEPPLGEPSDGDQDRDRDRDQDCGGGEPTCDGDGPGGPPAELPAPANPGRP